MMGNTTLGDLIEWLEQQNPIGSTDYEENRIQIFYGAL